jgi:hypothetical protein
MATAAERAMLQAFDVPHSTTATHPAAQREATLPLLDARGAIVRP